ncbi:hypothetical protein BC936DRAFT_142696, partial [Jimgerdemannia flammicorona]
RHTRYRQRQRLDLQPKPVHHFAALIGSHATQNMNCTQPFTFLLGQYQVDRPGPPLRATGVLHMMATMTELERELPAFDIGGRQIQIQYPIELTRVVGQVARVHWKVENVSKVDFGTLSVNGRIVRVRVAKMVGEVSASALRFGLERTQTGTATVPPPQTMKTEYVFDIPLLKAGDSLQLEAELALGEAAMYEGADLWIYLELGKIEQPSSPHTVHIQSFDIRVSTIYRGLPAGFSPDVLLVTNHMITRNEYVAWDNLIRRKLGLSFFIWDLSQMGTCILHDQSQLPIRPSPRL